MLANSALLGAVTSVESVLRKIPVTICLERVTVVKSNRMVNLNGKISVQYSIPIGIPTVYLFELLVDWSLVQ